MGTNKQIKVLVVEDNAINQLLISTILKLESFEVVVEKVMLLYWFRLLFSYQSAYKHWYTTKRLEGITGYFERILGSRSIFIGEFNESI